MNATATVTGVDTNANGVRDEVERHLHDRYGNDPVVLAAAMTTGRALQRVLSTSPTDTAAATALFESNTRAAGCLLQRVGKDAKKASEIATRLYVLTYNTPARLSHRVEVMAAVGPRTVSADSALSYC